MDIKEALAHIEIRHVLSIYARGVDRADLETLSSVYHPDGTDEHGSFSGLGTAFARKLIEDEKDMTAVGQHHITNVVIQMDGDDDARVESYFLAFHPHGDEGFLIIHRKPNPFSLEDKTSNTNSMVPKGEHTFLSISSAVFSTSGFSQVV